jgi:hypothetical protein
MRINRLLLASMLLGFVLSGIANSQTKASPRQAENKPPIKKSDIPEIPLVNSRITYQYTDFNFGEVPPGTKVTHNFPVSNTGPDTLIISKIKAG